MYNDTRQREKNMPVEFISTAALIAGCALVFTFVFVEFRSDTKEKERQKAFEEDLADWKG